MQAACLTFIHNENYGSIWQAAALRRVFEARGHTLAHIRYEPTPLEKARNLVVCGNSPALLWEGLQKRATRAAQAGARAKSAAFRAFKQSALDMTAPARTRDDLARLGAAFDLYVSGGDQIWSPVWLNPTYFLNFVAPGKRKIAYAPSFGVTDVRSRRKARIIGDLLQGYAAISVREARGVEIVRAVSGLEAACVVDPVCLLSADAWACEAETPDDLPAGGFILCYFMRHSDAYVARAKELSRALKLPLVWIPTQAAHYALPVPLLSGLSPRGFVGAMLGASFLLTDSFHGAAFAVTLGKDFFAFRRFSDASPTSKNARVYHLLDLVGLSDRLWDEGAPMDRGVRGLSDAARADALNRLAEARDASLRWLFEAVES